MLMPARSGMNKVFNELPRSAANAARELAVVLMRMRALLAETQAEARLRRRAREADLEPAAA